MTTSHNLRPIIIPDLSPLLPSEPGYSSPAESESSALFTPPCPDQQDRLLAFGSHSLGTELEPSLIRADHDDLKVSYKYRVHSDSGDSSLDSLTSPDSFHDIILEADAFSSNAPLSAYDRTRVHSSSQSRPTSSVQSKHKSANTYPSCTSSSISSSFSLDSTLYSPHFPEGHQLNHHFVRIYELGDELGSGGYGFVMTATHRHERREAAVKFIIKSKVPKHAWMVHEVYGRLPTEVMLLSVIDHEGIVKCLDLFEDSLYFYLVQELHGSPWHESRECSSLSNPTSMPSLTPSTSLDSLSSLAPLTPSSSSNLALPSSPKGCHESSLSTLEPPRPKFFRRPSYDLFECIEQSEHKRFSEDQARYVFSQIVDAVHYLDEQGVAHRDIKDENIVIDENLKVKLIDFGSATFVDPSEERPFYKLFFGTTAYAASEILQKKPYQAAPAEVWTLGVLLSYLLTGTSPFPTTKDAIAGRIVLPDNNHLSAAALDLMQACLVPSPLGRATIAQVKEHYWLKH